VVVEPAQKPAAKNNTVPIASTTRSTDPKTPKRGFFQRLNPVHLFSGSQKGSETVARYAYRSSAKPARGNRQEAERSFRQGLQAQQAQRLPEAIQAYLRATQADPAYYDAYYNLGVAATQSGDLPLALRSYETALAVRPESLDARYNFALLLKRANYPLDAAAELEKILAHYPNESRANLALANLYDQQLNQPAKAREHYLKVLETDPHNPQAAQIRYWLTENPAKR